MSEVLEEDWLSGEQDEGVQFMELRQHTLHILLGTTHQNIQMSTLKERK